MKKKIFILLLVIILIAVCFLVGHKIYNKIGMKMIEQIVSQNGGIAELIPSELKDDEKIKEITEGEEGDFDKIPITIGGVKYEKSDLPKDIMDHPFVKNIYQRFSASEIAEISAMMADGITKEERAKIKEIVLSRVSRDEIEELKRLYVLYY